MNKTLLISPYFYIGLVCQARQASDVSVIDIIQYMTKNLMLVRNRLLVFLQTAFDSSTYRTFIEVTSVRLNKICSGRLPWLVYHVAAVMLNKRYGDE